MLYKNVVRRIGSCWNKQFELTEMHHGDCVPDSVQVAFDIREIKSFVQKRIAIIINYLLQDVFRRRSKNICSTQNRWRPP
jgi:hypothetical protein